MKSTRDIDARNKLSRCKVAQEKSMCVQSVLSQALNKWNQDYMYPFA